MSDVNDVGRPARFRRIHVPELEPHVVSHGEPAEPRRVAGAEIAVHVVPGQPRVGQRAPRGLGVELGQRFVVGLSRRVLEDTCDVRLALDAHARPVSPEDSGFTAPNLPVCRDAERTTRRAARGWSQIFTPATHALYSYPQSCRRQCGVEQLAKEGDYAERTSGPDPSRGPRPR